MRKLISLTIPKRILMIVPIVGIIVFGSWAVWGQIGGNSVNGMVFGINRIPLTDVQVELLDEFGRTIKRTRTMSGGRYSFDNVPAGRLTIRVLTFDSQYEEQEQSIEIVNFTSSNGNGGVRTSGFDNVQRDFYLRLRKGVTLPAESVFVQEVPAKAKELYDHAIDDLENKKQGEAFKKLREALDLFPQYFDALEKLGTEYVQLNTGVGYQAAEILLQIAAKVNPRAFRSWRGLAFARFALKKYPESLLAAEKAIELNSFSVDVVALSGRLLRLDGKFAESEKRFLRAIELSHDQMPEIHWELAQLYAKNMERYGDAAKELRRFLKSEPNAKDAEQIRKLITEFEAKGNSK